MLIRLEDGKRGMYDNVVFFAVKGRREFPPRSKNRYGSHKQEEGFAVKRCI